MFANAIVAAALTFSAATGGTAATITEDSPDWKCATMGNHICGPKGDAPAGLYRDGQLIVPWTNYADPQADPLYGVMPGTEYNACWIEHKEGLPDESLYGDTALMPADATPIPCGQEDEALGSLDAQELAGPAKCTTDTDCARYALRNGMGFNGDSLGLPSGIVVDGYVTTDHGFEPVAGN